MFYQKKDYTCGPAAVRIAMRVLGYSPPSEAALEEVCGSSEAEGTDEDGVKRGILHFGFTFDEINLNSARHAMTALLEAQSPTVLCLDRWAHWATVIGVCGDRILLADPARFGYTIRTNGLLVYNPLSLLRRWRYGRRKVKDGGRFYGITVYPGQK